jgi:hypothetical protein
MMAVLLCWVSQKDLNSLCHCAERRDFVTPSFWGILTFDDMSWHPVLDVTNRIFRLELKIFGVLAQIMDRKLILAIRTK